MTSVVVPVEPTPEMIEAAHALWGEDVGVNYVQVEPEDFYRAMLATRPKPPADLVRAVIQATADGDHYSPISQWAAERAVEVVMGARQEVGDGKTWRDWKPTSHPPLDGEWFLARCPEAIRVVHYADKHDRLPIDHTGWVWPSIPTQWMPLSDFTALRRPSTVGEEATRVDEDQMVHRFEEWWRACRHRNRIVANYSTKKQLAWEAYCAAACSYTNITAEEGIMARNSSPPVPHPTERSSVPVPRSPTPPAPPRR